jgi:pimeloyl-ACP methyl ester carboxylesterase
MLGRELSAKGFSVLIIDQRGFGESEDPPSSHSEEAFSYVEDAKIALNALGEFKDVDRHRLYVIGHSFGAGIALRASLEDPRIKKIVAIGPTRRFIQRAGTPDAPEFKYFLHRWRQYMKLSQPVTQEVFINVHKKISFEKSLVFLSRPGHRPVLFIDGGSEAIKDLQFMRRVYDEIAEPKHYLTLADTDHYANTANFGPFVVYDKRVIQELSQSIAGWLNKTGEGD